MLILAQHFFVICVINYEIWVQSKVNIMKTLSKDWLIENHIDVEYKRYVLLAYLQEVSNNFDRNMLYPFLADLIQHYMNLKNFKQDTEKLTSSFPQKIKSVDMQKNRLIFEKLYENDDLIQELNEIITYSIPQFERYLNEGKKIYDFVEKKLHITQVGLLPLYSGEGYMLLSNGEDLQTLVYEYQMTVFEQATEKFRAIHTNYITSYKRSIINTNENIKRDLIRSNKKYPNPATFAVESEMNVPVNATLLPIAKRSLAAYVSTIS
jgi:hypothetical protein